MDIKRMHCMIEKLAEKAMEEFDKGIECVDACEMGQVTDMMKDLAEAMYYRTLTKAMDDFDTDDISELFGRFDSSRRHYTPNYRMTPEMYRNMENDRDMDRSNGRMYYGTTESGYDRAKRYYTETKELHRANTPQDKEAKMRGLEDYFKEISSDITGLLSDMTPEERSMLKSKISALATKL